MSPDQNVYQLPVTQQAPVEAAHVPQPSAEAARPPVIEAVPSPAEVMVLGAEIKAVRDASIAIAEAA